MILIYATKPELRPLVLLKDKSDAAGKIAEKLVQAEAKYSMALEAARQFGGTASTLGLDRWRSAKCAEVDIVGY